MKLRILCEYCIALLFIASGLMHAQNKCSSEQLLDGSEPLIGMGLDSTGHWWAVTSPFTKRYSMIIDGKKSIDVDSLQAPIFSADGNRFAYPVQRNGVWSIILNDTVISLGAGRPGLRAFSRNGIFAYSVIEGQSETLNILRDEGMSTYLLINTIGNLHLSFDGTHWAYQSKRSSGISLIMDEQELGRYDECIIAGFMMDNALVYAGKQGDIWRVNKQGEEILSSQFLQNVQVNQTGNAFACAYGIGTRMTGFLYALDFVKPIETVPYDRIDDLTIHPFEPLMGMIAFRSGMLVLTMNSSEYDAGLHVGPLRFTHDGTELYVCGNSDQDPYMIVNGKKFVQKNTLDINRSYAMAPGTNTCAYATSSAMMMQRLNDGFTHAGMMADYISTPLFNHKLSLYQSLGIVNNRLFLMSCKP